jgi:N utilization substance protein A
MAEALILDGFLSYDDLTFLEPAQLAELAGVTEEQAEVMIAYAEESAERVEEETRLAREAQAAAEAEAAAQGLQVTDSEAKPGGTPTAANLFPAGTSGAPSEAKQTFEGLFGPATPDEPQETLDAKQVLGESPAAENEANPSEKE